MPATLFAVFPLTFRYATESRVYSQAFPSFIIHLGFWVLPAVALLAASGAEKYPRIRLALAAGFCAVGIMQSVKYFTAPHEDFQLGGVLTEKGIPTRCVPGRLPQRNYPGCTNFSNLKWRLRPCDMPRLVLADHPLHVGKGAD